MASNSRARGTSSSCTNLRTVCRKSWCSGLPYRSSAMVPCLAAPRCPRHSPCPSGRRHRQRTRLAAASIVHAGPGEPGKRASPQRPESACGGSRTIVAERGRSVGPTGRLAFLATTLKATCPGPVPRILSFTIRIPWASTPVPLRHVQEVGRGVHPVPLTPSRPGAMATSMSDVPWAVARRKRTPSSCGLSGGLMGAGMTATPFTLSVSSSGGGSSRVRTSFGLRASVAFTHGSIASQRSSASASAQGSAVEVDVDVVELVLVVDEVDDDVLVVVVLDVLVDEVVVDDVLDVEDEVLVVVGTIDVLVVDEVLLDVLVVDDVLVLVVVVLDVLVVDDDVELVLVVLDEDVEVVVAPSDLSSANASNTVPALSMASSVSTSSLEISTEV